MPFFRYYFFAAVFAISTSAGGVDENRVVFAPDVQRACWAQFFLQFKATGPTRPVRENSPIASEVTLTPGQVSIPGAPDQAAMHFQLSEAFAKLSVTEEKRRTALRNIIYADTKQKAASGDQATLIPINLQRTEGRPYLWRLPTWYEVSYLLQFDDIGIPMQKVDTEDGVHDMIFVWLYYTPPDSSAKPIVGMGCFSRTKRPDRDGLHTLEILAGYGKTDQIEMPHVYLTPEQRLLRAIFPAKFQDGLGLPRLEDLPQHPVWVVYQPPVGSIK